MNRMSLGVLVVAACSSEGGLDTLGTRLGKASCQKIFQCCSADEVMTHFMNYTVNGKPLTTEAQCEQFFGGFFGAFATQAYKTSLSKHRINYDDQAAQACIDLLNSASCAQYNGIEDEKATCAPFIIPLVDNGGACLQDYECISNNCVGATNQLGSASSDGACMPLPAQGEACSFTCDKGLYCGYDSTAMKEVCQAQKANGATCSTAEQCTSDYCMTGSGSGSGSCADKPPMCTGM